MRPIRTQVLLKPFPSETDTTGGIFVPESCRERNNKMEVVQVGEGTKKNPMKRSVGDVVFTVQGHGQPVEINNEIYYLMDQKTILATL